MILEVQGPSEYLTQPDREIRIACFFGSQFFFSPQNAPDPDPCIGVR